MYIIIGTYVCQHNFYRGRISHLHVEMLKKQMNTKGPSRCGWGLWHDLSVILFGQKLVQ